MSEDCVNREAGGLQPYLSGLGAWALAVGTSIGWGSLVVTNNEYLAGAGPVGSVIGLECVSKSREMQFRVNLPAFQGAFPQAYWLQVKEKQHRNAVKDAENALRGF